MIFYRLCMLFLLGSVLFVYSSAGYAQDPTTPALRSEADRRLAHRFRTPKLNSIRANPDHCRARLLVDHGFGLFRSRGAFPDAMKRVCWGYDPPHDQAINSGQLWTICRERRAPRQRCTAPQTRSSGVADRNQRRGVAWITNNAKEMLSDAVRRLTTANTDVVLLDYNMRRWCSPRRHTRIEKIIIEVAREQKVGHFPRFLLMKRAIRKRKCQKGLVLWNGLIIPPKGHQVSELRWQK